MVRGAKAELQEKLVFSSAGTVRTVSAGWEEQYRESLKQIKVAQLSGVVRTSKQCYEAVGMRILGRVRQRTPSGASMKLGKRK
jgi:hypothetical protein